MGGRSTTTVADRHSSVQIQTSAYGIPLPVVFGTNRISGNLVWFGNFQAIPVTTQTGGKGMGGSSTNTTYDYKAAAILGLAEGPIAGVGSVWKDRDKTTLADLGLTLFTGTQSQATWSFLTGWNNTTDFAIDALFGYADMGATFVDQAINYSSTSYLASSSYNLGDAATVPNHSFEVQGFNIIGGGNPDANPADIIPGILTPQQYGVGFSGSQIASLTDYETYCQAVGLFFSPAYTQQRAAADCIKDLCDASNSAPVWSGGVLKIIPYGDTAITGNGATFTPNLTPVYDLSDDDFIENQGGPIKITRTTPADAYNRVQVQFRNRENQYNQEIVSVEDQDAIEKYGLKIAPVVTMDFVCLSAIAKQIAQLTMQRMLYKRNTYEFEINARFGMLEPMDIVTLTDPVLGLDRTPVRITRIEEQDHSYTITAEELPIGVAAAATYSHDDGLRWQANQNLPPLNCEDPIIFELPADPSATGLCVGIAAGGQTTDLMYGGCNIWLSMDGVNYKKEGTIWGSSRYGVTSASLAAHAAGIDTTNTLSVALRSNGEMLSGSTEDVNNATTLINVGGEYLAYKDATLTGTNAYNLTTLNRGLYGTDPSSHPSAVPWVRIDESIARLDDLDLTLIGETVYIKLTAFNVYGNAEQALSDVSAYTYTITGDMKALETPVDYDSLAHLPAINQNLMPFSQFETGTVDWGETADASAIGSTLAVALDTSGYYLGENFTATTGGQTVSLGALVSGDAFFPVWQGSRIALQCVATATGPINAAEGTVYWYGTAGTLLSSTVFDTISASPPDGNLQGFATVPSGAVLARIDVKFTTSGAGSGTIKIRQPSVSIAGATQTLFPPFTPGPNAYNGASETLIGFLDNEDASVPANSAGTVSSFANATGNFKVFHGLIDVSAECTFAVTAQTNCTGTINTATGTPVGGKPKGYYQVTAMTADSASLTMTATFNGTVITKSFTVSKSKAGSTGSTGPGGPVVQILAQNGLAFTYVQGVATPSSQTLNFVADRQNTSGSITWSTSPSITVTPSGTGNVNCAVTLANMGTNKQVVLTATDSATGVSDKVTIVLLSDYTATNGAPAGTNVGSISAGDVSSTINSGGGVANNQVVTASIQSNQVTNLTSAQTTGSVSGTSSTWVNAQTVSFTATGAPVQVSLGAVCQSDGLVQFQIRVKRNGTAIWTSNSLAYLYAQGFGTAIAYTIIDTPSAGSVTYDFEFYDYAHISGTSMFLVDRFLGALETKR